MKKLYLILFILFSSSALAATKYTDMNNDQKVVYFKKLLKTTPLDKKFIIGGHVVYCAKPHYMRKAALHITNNNGRVSGDYLTSIGCSWTEAGVVGYALEVDEKRRMIKIFFQMAYTQFTNDGWFRFEDVRLASELK